MSHQQMNGYLKSILTAIHLRRRRIMALLKVLEPVNQLGRSVAYLAESFSNVVLDLLQPFCFLGTNYLCASTWQAIQLYIIMVKIYTSNLRSGHTRQKSVGCCRFKSDTCHIWRGALVLSRYGAWILPFFIPFLVNWKNRG